MSLAHQITHVDYCLLRRNQMIMKFLKYKVLPSKKCIIQHKPLICDFKMRKAKDTRNSETQGKLSKSKEKS